MDRFDLRSEIIRALKARTDAKMRTSAGIVHFTCPRHEDATPSAWLRDHAWGCFACTPDAESLRSLAELLGIDVPKTSGFTIEDYASRKGFSQSLLERWGVRTAVSRYGNDVVAIPYRDATGTLLRTKFRAATKTFWADDGSGTHLYGLDLLAKRAVDVPVILVEGESDCHAAWSHGVLAIGVPGAGVWKPAWASHLDRRRVYVWREPDKGGDQFIAKVCASIPGALVMSLDGVKDLAVLHATVGKDFKTIVEQCMARALPAAASPVAAGFSPLLGITLDEMETAKLQPITAVPTPFPSWNAVSRGAGGGVGLARGWHVTVGANTGNGKSLLALNLSVAAIEAGESVGFVSLEMSREELATRLLSIESGFSTSELEQGTSFRVSSWRAAAQRLQAIYERTGGVVHVNDKRLRDLSDVADAIKYLHEFKGVRWVAIDYLQLVWIKGRREHDILERVQEVSGVVSALAKDLGVVLVALSQFNRQTSANRADPPTPQGLMGGSPLENDSDQVVLLDHSQYERDYQRNRATTRLLVAKNRHGSSAIVPVVWDYRTLQVRELVSEPTGLPSSLGPALQLVPDAVPPGSAA